MKLSIVYDHQITQVFRKICRFTRFLSTCNSLPCSRNSCSECFYKTLRSLFCVSGDNLLALVGQGTSIFQQISCQSVPNYSAPIFPKKNSFNFAVSIYHFFEFIVGVNVEAIGCRRKNN